MLKLRLMHGSASLLGSNSWGVAQASARWSTELTQLLSTSVLLGIWDK